MIDNSDSIAFTLYTCKWLKGHADISEISERSIERLYTKWKEDIIPWLDKPHNGECVGVEMRCNRCAVEAYFENATAIANVIKGYENDKLEITTETDSKVYAKDA